MRVDCFVIRFLETHFVWACGGDLYSKRHELLLVIVCMKRNPHSKRFEGAPGHIDKSGVWNIAFSIMGEGPDATYDPNIPLSKWVVVHPSYVGPFLRYLQQDLRKSSGHSELKAADLDRIALDLSGIYGGIPLGKVRILDQYHGQLVHLPPGVMHWVVNLQPNIKIALDGHLRCHFPAIIESYRLIGDQLESSEDQSENCTQTMPYIYNRLLTGLPEDLASLTPN